MEGHTLPFCTYKTRAQNGKRIKRGSLIVVITVTRFWLLNNRENLCHSDGGLFCSEKLALYFQFGKKCISYLGKTQVAPGEVIG